MMLSTLVTFDPQRAALDGPFGRHLDVLVKHLMREHPLVQRYKLSTALEDTARHPATHSRAAADGCRAPQRSARRGVRAQEAPSTPGA